MVVKHSRLCLFAETYPNNIIKYESPSQDASLLSRVLGTSLNTGFLVMAPHWTEDLLPDAVSILFHLSLLPNCFLGCTFTVICPLSHRGDSSELHHYASPPPSRTESCLLTYIKLYIVRDFIMAFSVCIYCMLIKFTPSFLFQVIFLRI
jgi:hypothetical protein